MRASQIKDLERVYQRRVPAHLIVTPELTRYLTELSLEIRRQIGIIISRKGEIVFTVVGDDKEILIPDLSKYRGGRGRLRGLRCVHTHLKGEDLTQDDLTDLALLRLDLMAAVAVDPQGLPGKTLLGYLLPENSRGERWRIEAYKNPNDFNRNFLDFIHSLEDELQKGFEVHHTDGKESAILVSVVPSGKSHPIEESLDELKELTHSTDLEVIDVVVQRPKKIHPKYLMGEGKLKDLIIKGLQSGADIIVFDQNLSPAQVNAIAEVTDLKVIDRTQLILDIFAKRAHSRDGKVKVELAQLKYLLPRLTGKGSAMSRLMGGIGGRGPGETKLEIDRRRIKDRIHHLERELKHLGRGRWQRRSKRLRQGLPIVSIVGYTNAGKSTLLNALTNSDVDVEEKLFATLDTSSRRLRFPKERAVIITDTVGFIRNLPPDLLGAFRSTLDELHDADLLLHVIDTSNPRFEDQMASVEELLTELALGHIPLLRVFNKEDKVESAFAEKVRQRYDGVSICALDRGTFFPLLRKIEKILWGTQEGEKGAFSGGQDERDHRELAAPLLFHR